MKNIKHENITLLYDKDLDGWHLPGGLFEHRYKFAIQKAKQLNELYKRLEAQKEEVL